MFTGIVEELGTVLAIERNADDSLRLSIAAKTVLQGTQLGDSISVNGVCLTVTDMDDSHFWADVIKETVSLTTISELAVDDRVNLERPVTLATRLGGHMVQGHVDGVGTIVNRVHSDNWDVVTIQVPQDLLRYVVHKGSITIDGTSLTVSEVTPTTLSVSLIPATLAKTTLGQRALGDHVNIEVDMMAKYIEKLVQVAT